MAPTKETFFKQPSPQRLISDSYYWKPGEDGMSIRYAYFHKDDDPSYSFLIMFDSSEANQYVVYPSLNEPDDKPSNCRIVISEFMLEVESCSRNIEEKSKKWSLCKKPDMVVSDRLVEIVKETIAIMNQRKRQKEQVRYENE